MPTLTLSSQTSDSGICRRMKTTSSAGSADRMKTARQPITGASWRPAIDAKNRANAEPLCRYEPYRPRTCGGTVSPTSACATAHSPPTPMPVIARASISDQKPTAIPDSSVPPL